MEIITEPLGYFITWTRQRVHSVAIERKNSFWGTLNPLIFTDSDKAPSSSSVTLFCLD